jgi:hypothetical protein
MIDVKQAVNAAIQYVRDFSEYLPTNGLRLEETELDEEGWHITLSFVDSVVLANRSYKMFDIDAETGQVRAMRARNMLVQKRA